LKATGFSRFRRKIAEGFVAELKKIHQARKYSTAHPLP
jgi:hypothetical protein